MLLEAGHSWRSTASKAWSASCLTRSAWNQLKEVPWPIPRRLEGRDVACVHGWAMNQIFCTVTNTVRGTQVSCWNSRLLSLTCFGALLRRFRYMGPVSLYISSSNVRCPGTDLCCLLWILLLSYYRLAVNKTHRLSWWKLQRREPIKFSIEGKQFFVHCFAAAARPAQKYTDKKTTPGIKYMFGAQPGKLIACTCVCMVECELPCACMCTNTGILGCSLDCIPLLKGKVKVWYRVLLWWLFLPCSSLCWWRRWCCLCCIQRCNLALGRWQLPSKLAALVWDALLLSRWALQLLLIVCNKLCTLISQSWKGCLEFTSFSLILVHLLLKGEHWVSQWVDGHLVDLVKKERKTYAYDRQELQLRCVCVCVCVCVWERKTKDRADGMREKVPILVCVWTWFLYD